MRVFLYKEQQCVVCKKDMTPALPWQPHAEDVVVLEVMEGERFGLPVIHDAIDWEVKRSRAILCPTCTAPLMDYLKEKGIIK